MSKIRADLSQYYATKALFEKILGRSAFLRVKDYGPLSAWRENYKKLLKSIACAAESTVEIADAQWHKDIKALITHGIKCLSNAKSIDELHASAAATLGELAFLQLGFVPQGHSRAESVPLVAKNWKLNQVRTVQYVQTKAQYVLQQHLAGRRNPKTAIK